MISSLIDVWSVQTFDEDHRIVLTKHVDLVRNYMKTENEIFVTYELGRTPVRPLARPTHSYAGAFLALEEALGELMQSRTIRAWHYTRLTAPEVDALHHDGIHLSTPATLRNRLDAAAAGGAVDAHLANALYAASPFHSDQLGARLDKFWMVSHPIAIDDPGVQPLMAHWGGEVASMWTKDPVLLAPLAVTGKPRVIEVAAPLAVTRQSYNAAKAVVATFGRSLGCVLSKHAFDLYITRPLSANAVLRIHTEGDASFNAIGLTYPEGYVDVDIGYWKELTGEDD